MAIKYKPIPKTSVIKGNVTQLYHAKTIANGSIEFDDFLKKISKKSSEMLNVLGLFTFINKWHIY